MRRGAVVLVLLALLACSSSDDEAKPGVDSAGSVTPTTSVGETSLESPGGVGQAIVLEDGSVKLSVKVLQNLEADPKAVSVTGSLPAGTTSYAWVVEWENRGAAPITPGVDFTFTILDSSGKTVVSKAEDFCTPSGTKVNGAAIAPGTANQTGGCINLTSKLDLVLKFVTTGTNAVDGFLALQ